jgi:hypothetical protein
VHKKARKKRVVTGQQRRSGRLADDPSVPARPTPASTSSASTGGGDSDLIRLLVGMSLVTVALMTAAAVQRRRARV